MLGDFQIAETDSFQKDMRACLGPNAPAIYAKLFTNLYPQLKAWPYYGRNIKKLKGYSPAAWRYRTGDYRIFYHIDPAQKIVILYAFELRKDAYK